MKAGRAAWESRLEASTTPQPPPPTGIEAPPSTSARLLPALTSPSQGMAAARVQYISMTIEPLSGRGDPAPFRYRVGNQDWQQADTPGIDGLLGDLAKQGYELVYMGRVGLGHATTAFGGAYECVFKR